MRCSVVDLDVRDGGCEIGENAKEYIILREGGVVRLILYDIER
jgi:hypothetical protein